MVYNYLNGSTKYGGTVDGNLSGYWTSSVYSNSVAWYMDEKGTIAYAQTRYTGCGGRAVIVIEK